MMRFGPDPVDEDAAGEQDDGARQRAEHEHAARPRPAT